MKSIDRYYALGSDYPGHFSSNRLLQPHTKYIRWQGF